MAGNYGETVRGTTENTEDPGKRFQEVTKYVENIHCTENYGKLRKTTESCGAGSYGKLRITLRKTYGKPTENLRKRRKKPAGRWLRRMPVLRLRGVERAGDAGHEAGVAEVLQPQAV